MYAGKSCEYLLRIQSSYGYWNFVKLADLANLTQPWCVDPAIFPPNAPRFSLMVGFKNQTKDVPIPLETLEREYCNLTKQPYPIPEMVFARSWMLFRVSLARWSPHEERMFTNFLSYFSFHSWLSFLKESQPDMREDRLLPKKHLSMSIYSPWSGKWLCSH